MGDITQYFFLIKALCFSFLYQNPSRVFLWVVVWLSSCSPDSASALPHHSWSPPGCPALKVSCRWIRAALPVRSPRQPRPSLCSDFPVRTSEATPWFVPRPSQNTSRWNPPAPSGCCSPTGRSKPAGFQTPRASGGRGPSARDGRGCERWQRPPPRASSAEPDRKRQLGGFHWRVGAVCEETTSVSVHDRSVSHRTLQPCRTWGRLCPQKSVVWLLLLVELTPERFLLLPLLELQEKRQVMSFLFFNRHLHPTVTRYKWDYLSLKRWSHLFKCNCKDITLVLLFSFHFCVLLFILLRVNMQISFPKTMNVHQIYISLNYVEKKVSKTGNT